MVVPERWWWCWCPEPVVCPDQSTFLVLNLDDIIFIVIRKLVVVQLQGGGTDQRNGAFIKFNPAPFLLLMFTFICKVSCLRWTPKMGHSCRHVSVDVELCWHVCRVWSIYDSFCFFFAEKKPEKKSLYQNDFLNTIKLSKKKWTG